MKHLNLFVLFFLLVFNLEAQNVVTTSKSIDPKAFLIFSAGPSLPVGIFSSTDFEKSGSGFANVGFNLNFNGGYLITDRFGVAGTVFYSKYNVNNKINDNLNSLTAINSYSFSTDHWQYAGIVVGPMVSFNVVDKVNIDFKAMAGFARANSPMLKAIDNSTGEVAFTSEDKWVDAFAIQAGTNLRYNFAPRFCAFANLDYGFMHPKWATTGEEDFKQEMGVIDFNIGIGTTF